MVTGNTCLKFSITRTPRSLALPSWMSINGIFFAYQLRLGKSISVFCCLAWSWHSPGLAVGAPLSHSGGQKSQSGGSLSLYQLCTHPRTWSHMCCSCKEFGNAFGMSFLRKSVKVISHQGCSGPFTIVVIFQTGGQGN